MKNSYDLIRRMVVKSLEDDSTLEFEDAAYRWYSKTFCTPLMEAYKIPAPIVIYYKWKEELEGIDKAALNEEKERFVKPNWNIVLQDRFDRPTQNDEMDDEAWIAEEEAKIKAQQLDKPNVTDEALIKEAHDAIRSLTSKLTSFKDEPDVIPKEEEEQ